MSASFTSPQRLDGLEKLLVLATLNKDNIAAAHEEERRQIQLTNEEKGKVAEARSYITKHAALATDLQRREDELAAGKLEYGKQVSDFAGHLASENKRLEAFAAKLSVQQREIENSSKSSQGELQRIAGLKIDQERQHREAMAALQASERTAIATTHANAAEEQRLKEWEATLKAKAQRLREQAASF